MIKRGNKINYNLCRGIKTNFTEKCAIKVLKIFV